MVISVDEAANVQAYLKTHATSYPLPVSGMDISPLAGELGNKAMALPFTVFVGADGRLRSVKLGALKEAELQNLLRTLQTPG